MIGEYVISQKDIMEEPNEGRRYRCVLLPYRLTRLPADRHKCFRR